VILSASSNIINFLPSLFYFLQKCKIDVVIYSNPLLSEAFNSNILSYVLFIIYLAIQIIVLVFPVPGEPVNIKFGTLFYEIIFYILFNIFYDNIKSSTFFGLCFSIHGKSYIFIIYIILYHIIIII
jgi:hypothetical protein